MSKFFGVLMLAVAMLVPAYSQDCGTVIDNAHVLDTSKLQDVIGRLQAAGAEPHFVTSDQFAGASSIDAEEKNFELNCPDWKNTDGKRKNNLLVFAVAVKAHKTGLYAGSYFNRSLSNQLMSISSEEMNPKFRDHDFTGGFVAGGESAISYINASKTVSSGHTTIVNEKPADYTGLWTVLKWITLFLILGAMAWFIYYLYSKNHASKEDKLSAQRSARYAKQLAVNQISGISSDELKEDEKKRFATIQSRLDNLTSSIKYDVDSDLEVEDYKSIAQQYMSVYTDAKNLQDKTPNTTSPDPFLGREWSSIKSQTPKSKPSTKTTTHTIVNNTTYVDNTPYVPYIPTPVVIVDEPVYRPSYREPDPTPTYSPSSSDDSSSSSSSWGSDSGSSFSSDFGSDSGSSSSSDW